MLRRICVYWFERTVAWIALAGLRLFELWDSLSGERRDRVRRVLVVVLLRAAEPIHIFGGLKTLASFNRHQVGELWYDGPLLWLWVK